MRKIHLYANSTKREIAILDIYQELFDPPSSFFRKKILKTQIEK